MTLRQRIVWMLVCAVVLVVFSQFGFAQPSQKVPINPTIISGADLRFVVESQKAESLVGHFEARINGAWMRVQPNMAGRGGIQPLTSSR